MPFFKTNLIVIPRLRGQLHIRNESISVLVFPVCCIYGQTSHPFADDKIQEIAEIRAGRDALAGYTKPSEVFGSLNLVHACTCTCSWHKMQELALMSIGKWLAFRH